MGKKQQPIQIGEVFGKLTVIRKSERTDNGFRTYYDCQCECGGTKTIRGTNLRFGFTTSCGCKHSSVAGAINRKEPGAVSWTALVTSYKAGARVRKYSYDLTEEQFKTIAEKDCHYCGEEPQPMNYYLKADNITMKKGKSRKVTQQQIKASWIKANGIDRVDSSIGYTTDNCVPCCWKCNLFKNDLQVDDFLSHVKKIARFSERSDGTQGTTEGNRELKKEIERELEEQNKKTNISSLKARDVAEPSLNEQNHTPIAFVSVAPAPSTPASLLAGPESSFNKSLNCFII